MLKTRFVYGNNDALLEISSAHNFGACTNVSCLNISVRNEHLPVCQIYMNIDVVFFFKVGRGRLKGKPDQN